VDDDREISWPKWFFKTIWSGFPLGRIETGLFPHGKEMTEFGTTWSKSVGVIALLWFLFYVFVDISNFGADATARDRFMRF
jgi:hypothetical protein